MCQKGIHGGKEMNTESHIILFIFCNLYLHLGCRTGSIYASPIFSRIITTHRKSDWLIYEVANGQNYKRGCLQLQSALLSTHSYLPYHIGLEVPYTMWYAKIRKCQKWFSYFRSVSWWQLGRFIDHANFFIFIFYWGRLSFFIP